MAPWTPLSRSETRARLPRALTCPSLFRFDDGHGSEVGQGRRQDKKRACLLGGAWTTKSNIPLRLNRRPPSGRDVPKTERDGRTAARAGLRAGHCSNQTSEETLWLDGCSQIRRLGDDVSQSRLGRLDVDLSSSRVHQHQTSAPRKVKARPSGSDFAGLLGRQRRLVLRGDSRGCDNHVMSARANDEKSAGPRVERSRAGGAARLHSTSLLGLPSRGAPLAKRADCTTGLVLDVGRCVLR